MVFNIGSEETHGELIGENTDSLESECTLTISPLKLIVLGGLLKTKLLGFNHLKKKLKLSICENHITNDYLLHHFINLIT